MFGTFENVDKSKHSYCYIKTDDGKQYFFHKSALVRKQDWKYVWNGNKCIFQILKDNTLNKKNIVSKVEPFFVKNMNKKKEKQDKEKYKNNVKIKRAFHNEKKKQERLKWEQFCKDHLFYVIVHKKRGVDISYQLDVPVVVWKDLLQAKEYLCFKKAERGDINNYLLRKVIVSKQNETFVVREILKGNKLGKVLFIGEVHINA